jgi:ribosome-associated toxin RatA of RatAB toxin-antitoxin module
MNSATLNAVTLALAVAARPGSTTLLSPSAPPTIQLAPADGRAPAPTGEPRVESFPVRGSSIERVRATVVVGAPVERVRAVVFDFARYPEYMPRYEKAGVLRATPNGGRLVHMELGGVVHLWMRVEIAPPVTTGRTEAYEGRLVQGNVKYFTPRWEIEPLDEGRTRLVVESFMDPDLPFVPSSFVNKGAREGVRDAIVALKSRIERR